MINAFKYKDKILDNFYLDDDDITIRRKKNASNYKYKKDDIVNPYTLKGSNGIDYKGIWVPGTRTTVSLPWILTVLRGIDFNEKSVIDHIDGNVSNNSRSNLRVTTQSINCKNKKMRYDNKTGYTGISYNKSTNRYYIRKTINGKRFFKSTKTLNEAIEVLDSMKDILSNDGYSERHGKCCPTTIESTL
jgi:hypothetical protein